MSGRGDATSWALVMALGVIWGASFTVTSYAVRDLGPLTLAAARLVLAALALLPLAYWLGDGLPGRRSAADRRIWRNAAITAFAANAAPFALLSWAQTETESAVAGALMATLPLIVLPLAHAFVPGERMTAAKSIGFSVGFCGLASLIGLEAFAQLGGSPIEVVAQIACVAAATGYAIGSVVAKITPPAHPLSFAAATLLLAAGMSAPWPILFEAPLSAPWSAELAVATLYLGLLPTALATLLLLTVIQRTGPTFLATVNYLVPLWSLLFGVTLLGETPPPQTPLALALIFLGLAIAQGVVARAWRRVARRPRPEREPQEEDGSAEAASSIQPR